MARRTTKGARMAGSLWRVPTRSALLGDLLEPVPRQRRGAGRRCDQLDDDWVRRRLLPALEGGVALAEEPPLGAVGQRLEARVVGRPVERRVVFEVDRNELRIVHRLQLVGEPDRG